MASPYEYNNGNTIPNSPQGLHIYNVWHRRTINERDIPNSPQGLYIYNVWHRRTINERDIPNSPQGLYIYNVWHRRTNITMATQYQIARRAYTYTTYGIAVR